MGNAEVLPFLTHEHAPVNRLSDAQLLSAIMCKGFQNAMQMNTLRFTDQKYHEVLSPETGGRLHIKTGHMLDQHGNDVDVRLVRDLDNAGVVVRDRRNDELTHVIYRDRSHDGTLGATPPHILTMIGSHPPDTIPERSHKVGATSWYYSSPTDVQADGRRSVEFSITSSDPSKSIEHFLEQKENKLSVPPKLLAQFIDNPFSYIPFDHPTPEAMNQWWTLWWHVVQRGLREKKIPYPGQTSQSGFEGFFTHVLETSKQLLKPLGYTHLSGVPTWYYVWNLNIKNGFVPDDTNQHAEATAFFERLHRVKLPSGKRLDELDYKSGLYSWIAVAPFMMQLAPEYIPELHIDHKFVNGDFKDLYQGMMDQFYDKDQRAFYTYPLAPGRNLWHSLDLSL